MDGPRKEANDDHLRLEHATEADAVIGPSQSPPPNFLHQSPKMIEKNNPHCLEHTVPALADGLGGCPSSADSSTERILSAANRWMPQLQPPPAAPLYSR
jgi:hypothetical protein